MLNIQQFVYESNIIHYLVRPMVVLHGYQRLIQDAQIAGILIYFS